MERKRRVFPEAFKRKAVERVHASGVPIVRVAEELGLREPVLRRWICRFGGGTAAPSSRRSTSVPSMQSPADLAAENVRLKRVLHRAEMERDILKKPRSSSEGPPSSRDIASRCPAGRRMTFGFVPLSDRKQSPAGNG